MATSVMISCRWALPPHNPINLFLGLWYRAASREASADMSDRADPFEWSGGHPALDLVNTLDERPSARPVENLATYRDLTRFAALAGLIDRRTAVHLERLDSAGSQIVKRARKLREHLH